MKFIEATVSNAKTLIAISEIVQVFRDEHGKISIALRNNDVITTEDTYEEIRKQLSHAKT